MTLEADDRKFITQKFFTQKVALAALGVFVLIGLLVGAFVLGGSVKAIKHLFVQNSSDSGDTPVVLVGGSLTYKSGAQTVSPPLWTAVSSKEYSIDPKYTIAKIVVKKNAPPDPNDNPVQGDAKPGSDKLVVDVSDAGTWEIDAYTVVSGNLVKVASLMPISNTTKIHVLLTDTDQTARLCHDDAYLKINYGHNATCTDTVVFDSVSLTVDGVQTGTFNCTDTSGSKGKCRIVLRGSPS